VIEKPIRKQKKLVKNIEEKKTRKGKVKKSAI
jgi:hypothetical protein